MRLCSIFELQNQNKKEIKTFHTYVSMKGFVFKEVLYMKYDSKNRPLVCMHTDSIWYNSASKMKPLGILWHSTGANNPALKRYVQPSNNASDRATWLTRLGVNKYNNDWNHFKQKKGVNAFIGQLANGAVASVQVAPWEFAPWGCGSGKKGSCNSGWIQFEICEDNLKNTSYFNQIYKEACELTAYLCKLYNLNPNGTVNFNGVTAPVILCHADSHKLGLGSNHGDVLHWFKKHGKTMDDVRKDVAELLKEPVRPTASSTTSNTTTNSTLNFETGDIVNFKGGKQYASSNAASGVETKACRAKITSVLKTGKHQYHIRAVDTNGNFVSGAYGWVDASLVSAIQSVVSAKPQKGDTIKVTTNDILYASATSKTGRKFSKAGTYYIYDGEAINGRYRITNSKSRVGKKPVALNVTGYIKL